MSTAEIISLIVSIIALVSLCIVFTIFLTHYCSHTILDIKLGKQDIDLLDRKLNDKEKEKSKKYKTINILKKVGTYTVVSLAIALVGVSIYSKATNNVMVFNHKALAVASGSMSKKNEANTYLEDINNQIKTFDLIYVDRVNSEEELKKYDVVAYVNDKNTVIIHRIIDIVEIDGTTFYYTRGDANNVTDPFVSTFDDIIGVYHDHRVPIIGMFSLFAKSYIGIATLIAIIYYVFLFDHVTKKISDESLKRIDSLTSVINNVENPNDVKTSFVQYIYYDNNIYQFENGEFVSKLDSQNIINQQPGIVLSNDEEGNINVSSSDEEKNETKVITKKTKSKKVKKEE